MKFTIEIQCDNAAFEGDNLKDEIARILRSVSEALPCTLDITGYPQAVRDWNGNKVGFYLLKEEE